MSALDKIAETLVEVIEKSSSVEVEKLRSLMANYEVTYPRTVHGLKKIPGFRKIWDAMDEGCGMSFTREMEAESWKIDDDDATPAERRAYGRPENA